MNPTGLGPPGGSIKSCCRTHSFPMAETIVWRKTSETCFPTCWWVASPKVTTPNVEMPREASLETGRSGVRASCRSHQHPLVVNAKLTLNKRTYNRQ